MLYKGCCAYFPPLIYVSVFYVDAPSPHCHIHAYLTGFFHLAKGLNKEWLRGTRGHNTFESSSWFMHQKESTCIKENFKARYLIPRWRLRETALCSTLNVTHIALNFLTIRFERPGFPRSWDSNGMNYSLAFSFKQASLSRPVTNTKHGTFWPFTSFPACEVRTRGNRPASGAACCLPSPRVSSPRPRHAPRSSHRPAFCLHPWTLCNYWALSISNYFSTAC